MKEAENMCVSHTDIGLLLRAMEPRLNPGVFAFVTTPDRNILAGTCVVAMIHEPEGISAVLKESDAIALGLRVIFRAEWVTLTVQSDLQAVGLTAAFAHALAAAGISCNVIAGVYHDHIFVPAGLGEEAIVVLRNLQTSS
jgi:uncharacterized protein